MSDNKITAGWIGVLQTLVDHEVVAELLYEAGDKLSVNYEGTLIYTKDVDGKDYEFGLKIGSQKTGEAFINEVRQAGYYIDTTKGIQPFVCHWYNGTDFPVDEYTLDEFLQEPQQ